MNERIKDAADRKADELVERIWQVASGAAQGEQSEQRAARALIKESVAAALRSMGDAELRQDLSDARLELGELRSAAEAQKPDDEDPGLDDQLTAARTALQLIRQRVIRPAETMSGPLERAVVDQIADIALRGLTESARPNSSEILRGMRPAGGA